MKPEYNDLAELMNFKGVPDIMPVERLSQYTLEDNEKNRVADLIE